MKLLTAKMGGEKVHVKIKSISDSTRWEAPEALPLDPLSRFKDKIPD